MKRKIAVFTGGRFEYGILRPVIREIQRSKKLDMQLVVSGVHFLDKYGLTIEDIKKDKLPIAASANFTLKESIPGRVSLEIGDGVKKLTRIFLKLQPDIVLVTGDRSETFAAAIAAAFIPTFVAHLHGGDLTKAGFDESIRHAITKISHIHFPATEMSAKRIVRMGEDPKSVFVVGAPGLDDLLVEKKLSINQLEKNLGGKIFGKVLVILQHPVSNTPETAGKEIIETLKAIEDIEGTKVIIYPNGDNGSGPIISEIEKLRGKKDFVIVKNLNRNTYANLLRKANVFIGNSSGGIIETASFGLPTINIGPRQFGRQRNKNIVDVSYNRGQIKKTILEILNIGNLSYKRNLYGDGSASKKLVKKLEEINLNHNLLQKFFYENKNK